MPIKGMSPKEVVHTEMHKFKKGTLHSGSKSGPKVKSRKQAVAIALSESGQSKNKGAVDRSAHFKGNPGFPSSSEASSPPPDTYQTHEKREREVMGAGYEQHEKAEQQSYRKGGSHTFGKAPAGAHGFGHGVHQRFGPHRLSGHKGAHMIGRK